MSPIIAEIFKGQVQVYILGQNAAPNFFSHRSVTRQNVMRSNQNNNKLRQCQRQLNSLPNKLFKIKN